MIVKEERPKVVKKPKEDLKDKRNEHVHSQPKVIKAVEHKVKEAPAHHEAKPQKVVVKKDHKLHPEVAKPAQKEAKVHHEVEKRAVKLPKVKPVHVAPKPKKNQDIVSVIEQPKTFHSKNIMDITDDDDEMDS